MKLCLTTLGAATAGYLVGCGEDGDAFAEPSENAYQVQTPSTPGTSSTWAVGGTKALQGDTPDPFLKGNGGAACALYPALTIGPCYSNGPASRKDISDGMTGVPVRISFLVVRGTTCSPVPNAVVDIWHTGSNGVYSAFASGVCNPDRLPVVSQRFCRGTQTTDANGRADFHTIYPGWYSGRAIHTHFTVRAGSTTFTSQLFYEDALNEEIALSTEYRSRGKPRTTNKTDGIVRSVSLSSVLFSTEKLPDGSLHAWKVLSIRG